MRSHNSSALPFQVWAGNVEDYESAKVVGHSEAVDAASGRSLHLFGETRIVMEACQAARCPIAIASASSASETALRLLRSFGLPPVSWAEIHPGKKDAHLNAIAAALRVPLDRALFFDDRKHNIRTAELLGVGGCVQVNRGLTAADMRAALSKLRESGHGSELLRGWLGSASSSSVRQQKTVSEVAFGGAAPVGASNLSSKQNRDIGNASDGATLNGAGNCNSRQHGDKGVVIVGGFLSHSQQLHATPCTKVSGRDKSDLSGAQHSFDTFEELTSLDLAQLESAERNALAYRQSAVPPRLPDPAARTISRSNLSQHAHQHPHD